jgi:hypothetical protein
MADNIPRLEGTPTELEHYLPRLEDSFPSLAGRLPTLARYRAPWDTTLPDT